MDFREDRVEYRGRSPDHDSIGRTIDALLDAYAYAFWSCEGLTTVQLHTTFDFGERRTRWSFKDIKDLAEQRRVKAAKS